MAVHPILQAASDEFAELPEIKGRAMVPRIMLPAFIQYLLDRGILMKGVAWLDVKEE